MRLGLVTGGASPLKTFELLRVGFQGSTSKTSLRFEVLRVEKVAKTGSISDSFGPVGFSHYATHLSPLPPPDAGQRHALDVDEPLETEEQEDDLAAPAIHTRAAKPLPPHPRLPPSLCSLATVQGAIKTTWLLGART